MKIFEFEREQWLSRPLEEVFLFFGDVRNLQILTPPWLNFEILTPGVITMHPGTLIDYRLRLHGIPLRWQSEITIWDPPHRFVDEQRRGPYRMWCHEHQFEGRSGKTLVRDHIRYAVPGGWLINSLFVARDVEEIFCWRGKKLQDLFRERVP
jgi:ligand-binding SRPBCC domain-containing protein